MNVLYFRWVLSAAHCVRSVTENPDGSITSQAVPPNNVTLVLGAHELTENNLNLTGAFK